MVCFFIVLIKCGYLYRHCERNEAILSQFLDAFNIIDFTKVIIYCKLFYCSIFEKNL